MRPVRGVGEGHPRCTPTLNAEVTEATVLEATIRGYAADWAARDREAWRRTFAAEATQEDPVGASVRRGQREIDEFWDREMARYQSGTVRRAARIRSA